MSKVPGAQYLPVNANLSMPVLALSRSLPARDVVSNTFGW
jgi:hypothetical protein